MTRTCGSTCGRACSAASSPSRGWTEAQDGVDALAKLGASVDILVTDVVLPKLDGLSLCAKLDNDLQRRNLPVVLITGCHEFLHRARLYAQHRTDRILLEKPFNARQLQEAVLALLAKT